MQVNRFASACVSGKADARCKARPHTHRTYTRETGLLNGTNKRTPPRRTDRAPNYNAHVVESGCWTVSRVGEQVASGKGRLDSRRRALAALYFSMMKSHKDRKEKDGRSRNQEIPPSRAWEEEIGEGCLLDWLLPKIISGIWGTSDIRRQPQSRLLMNAKQAGACKGPQRGRSLKTGLAWPGFPSLTPAIEHRLIFVSHRLSYFLFPSNCLLGQSDSNIQS